MTWRHAPQGLQSLAAEVETAIADNVHAPRRDRVEDSHPLGADGQAERGIFDVAAFVNRAVAEQHRRADGEVRVGRIGRRLRFPRRGDQFGVVLVRTVSVVMLFSSASKNSMLPSLPSIGLTMRAVSRKPKA